MHTVTNYDTLIFGLRILIRYGEQTKMQLTEQQYDEIMKNPVGVGVFMYHNTENGVSQLTAARSEIIAYHPEISKKPKQTKLTPQPQNNYAATKVAVILLLGLLFLWMTIGGH